MPISIWMWSHPVEHKKPTNSHCLNKQQFLFQQLSTANKSSVRGLICSVVLSRWQLSLSCCESAAAGEDCFISEPRNSMIEKILILFFLLREHSAVSPMGSTGDQSCSTQNFRRHQGSKLY